MGRYTTVLLFSAIKLSITGLLKKALRMLQYKIRINDYPFSMDILLILFLLNVMKFKHDSHAQL